MTLQSILLAALSGFIVNATPVDNIVTTKSFLTPTKVENSLEASVLALSKDLPEGVSDEHKYNSEDHQKYKAWAEECIDFSKSRKGRYCLVVDKAAHTMDLYVKGEFLKTYRIELGGNSIDDKEKSGDSRTPEGIYTIDFVHHRSSFHEGLRINYPNSKDREEFAEMKKNGVVSSYDSIGGAIFIHGSGSADGSTPGDWTLGCMALSNSNIENLYHNIGLGEFLPMRSKERKRTQSRFKRKLRNLKVGIVRYGGHELSQ
jgi:murein L,D-transpeptidase YafK